MMPCTILYVNPTEALIIQARKRILLSLLKKLRENMREKNQLFNTIISKYNKQAFNKAFKKHSMRQKI